VSIYFYSYETSTTSNSAYQGFSQNLFGASLVLGILSAAVFFLRKKIELKERFIASALFVITFLQFIFWSYEAFTPSLSGYNLAQKVRPYLDAKTAIYAVQGYEQSLPFYLQRKVIIVNLAGELDFGLYEGHEDIHWHPLMDTFLKEWTASDNAVAIMSPESYKNLQGLGVLMTKVFQDLRWVIITRTTPRNAE
jgi:hypothetical protein